MQGILVVYTYVTFDIFQEDLLSLRKLPTEAQIEDVRRQRYERAERQIQLERKRMQAEVDKAGEGSPGPSGGGRANTLEHNVNTTNDDNPLLEQMNIIRGYIKEARKELKFEEVCFYFYPSLGYSILFSPNDYGKKV